MKINIARIRRKLQAINRIIKCDAYMLYYIQGNEHSLIWRDVSGEKAVENIVAMKMMNEEQNDAINQAKNIINEA